MKRVKFDKLSNAYLVLIFGALLLGGSAGLEVANRVEHDIYVKKMEVVNKLNVVSAQAISDVKKTEQNGRKSYSVDVDLDNNGTKDWTVNLLDNVKYVSPERLKKIEKIKKDSKIMFECLYDYNNTVDVDGQRIFINENISSISGSKKVGLVDDIFVIDGDVVGKPQNPHNRMSFYFAGDTLDCGEGFEMPKEKINDKKFHMFFASYLRHNVK